MVSLILSIVAAIVIIAGVAYAYYIYSPIILDFIDQLSDQFEIITSLIPSWLYPFVTIVLLVFVIGIIIKLL